MHVEEGRVGSGVAIKERENVRVMHWEGLPELDLLLDLGERGAMNVLVRVSTELMRVGGWIGVKDDFDGLTGTERFFGGCEKDFSNDA